MRALSTPNFILFSILILLIPVFMTDFIIIAYGQTAPKPIQPSISIPAETAPNPNLQYLPQKAYVQAYAPEIGLPASPTALTQLTTQPVSQPVVQNGTIGGMDIGDILSMVISAGSGFAAKLGFDKAKKAQSTTQDIAETQTKIATVQQKTLEQVYENMPDKGNNITDKPEIKLAEVAKVKEEALKTASKA